MEKYNENKLLKLNTKKKIYLCGKKQKRNGNLDQMHGIVESKQGFVV